MISVFKNFVQKPEVLTSKKVSDSIDEILKFNEVKSKLPDIGSKVVNKNFFLSREVRTELQKIYHDKCAYCEQKTETVIDHYRPKSIYPWLVFEWSNLLPVCTQCNMQRRNKLEKRGLNLLDSDIKNDPDFLRADSEFLIDEEIILLHPEIDSPENHIYIDARGSAVGRTDRGRYTIEILNLNRDILFDKRALILNDLREEFTSIYDQLFPDDIATSIDLIKVPKVLESFLDRFQKKLNPKIEFLRLYQCIWEFDYLFEMNIAKDYELGVFNSEILYRWKKVYQLKKLQLKRNQYFKRPFISSFNLQNIEGIRTVHVEGLRAFAPWIFLTGDNGYGKSTLLKALASGLSGEEMQSSEMRSQITIISKDEYEPKGEDKLSVKTLVFQSDAFKPYNNVVAYGPNRTKVSSGFQFGKGKLFNLFRPGAELLNIEQYLLSVYLTDSSSSKYALIVNTLKKVIPQLADIRVAKKNEISEVQYYEYDEERLGVFKKVNFEHLATGIKSIVAMVGDILCRLLIDQPINEPQDIEGIVIIDELDIHLHPKWQRELPTLLSEAFPKVQFIASTHSAIPLVGAPEGSVFLKVSRSIEHGVKVERLEEIEENIKNMLPNIIYTSELFDLGSVTPVMNENEREVMTQDNLEEAKEFERIKESIGYKPLNDEEFLSKLRKI